MDLVSYLQSKLDTIRSNAYIVSKERNIDTDYSKHEVIVSALSGNVYKEAGSIPYQIDIITKDIDQVMGDFIYLAKNNNGVSYTQVVNNSAEVFESITIVPFFNTPVVMDKELEIGSDKYARIVVFASINEQENVNNIKYLEIDDEAQEIINAHVGYVVEADPARRSGQELTPSKKRTASLTVTFTAVAKSSIFLNKAFKVVSGALPGNTSFSVRCKLDNGLEFTLPMFIGSYTLSTERAKLPSVNVGLFLYDNRGDSNATS